MVMDGVDTKVDCTKCPGITINQTSSGRIVSEKRNVRCMDGMVGSVRYGVHNPSLVNLCRGVVERVLFTRDAVSGVLRAPLKPVKNVYDRLRSLRSAIVRCTRSTNVVEIEDYPSLYHDARKRALYTRAVSSLSQEGITKRDARVNTFVKAEKINFTSKPDPPPRVIQPRTARYNVCVGRYLKPFEKALFLGIARFAGYNVVSKGLNACGTAELIREGWESFNDPVAIGLDASRFDQHVSRDALKFEHGFYNMIFNSPELAQLLSWQLHNIGTAYVGQHRVRYTVDGCRMSGDINTGMGNCVIMSSIVLGYFKSKNLKARLVNNGDDCVVILERSDINMMQGIDDWFSEFGFKLTREPVVDVFERIEFCQTQPVLCQDGWRMVRNPYTATSKDMVSLLGWNTNVEFAQWCDAIGKCGLSLCRGVPFWESFYSRFVGVSNEGVYDRLTDSGLGFMAKGMSSNAVVTEESRYSFWLAFGMLPDQQIALEQLAVQYAYHALTPLMFGDIRPLSGLLNAESQV